MTPQKFVKKPVVIEAVQLPWHEFGKLSMQQVDELMSITNWCGGRLLGICIYIDTLEGTMQAEPGDWIIRGVAGEFYPCKPNIFKQTYEAVES